MGWSQDAVEALGYRIEGDRVTRIAQEPLQGQDVPAVVPATDHVPGAILEASYGQHTPLVAYLPIRLVSESNQREHWAQKHQRAKEQRYTVYYNLRCSYWRVPPLPLTITLTRIAPRVLDADNLVSCFKSSQDGVADWLAGAEGQGQDRVNGLTWQYTQERGKPREYRLRITIMRTP